MKAADFVTLAAKVVAFGPAGARTSISRAYYGVFHECRAVLGSFGAKPAGSGASHATVPNYFQSALRPDAIEIGNNLSDLHSARVRADYDLADSRYEELVAAQNHIMIAQDTLRLLDRFRETCLHDDNVKRDLLQAIAKVDSIRQRT